MDSRLNKQLEFICEIDKMKSVLRRTIVIDKSHRENDAEHSWHISVMAMLLSEYASFCVDVYRVIKMLLVHDLVEVYAGDTFCYDYVGAASKASKESAAADKLFAMLPEDQCLEFCSLWEEFEACSTNDALFAAAMDRLEPFLINVKTDGHTWKLGSVTKAMVLERVDKIRISAPKLYDVVLDMIDKSIEDGLLCK